MRLFSLDGTMDGGYTVSIHHELLEDVSTRKVKALCDDLSRRNAKFFETESEKPGFQRELRALEQTRSTKSFLSAKAARIK